MRTRIIAIILAFVLLLIPMSALGAGGEGFEDQYRIGTDDQILVEPREVDPGDQLRLNGYYYRPDFSAVQRLIVKTGDLVTAVRLASAAEDLQQQGINTDDLFIRNGNAFVDIESTKDLSPAERIQRLTNVRSILKEADVSAKDLAGKEFTLEDGSGHVRSFGIQSVWQSPIKLPEDDSSSKAAPPEPEPEPEPEQEPEPEGPIPAS